MLRLSVMTWNLLHKAPCEDERDHPWASRRAGARAVVEDVRPDVFAAQEAFPEQMDDVLENLPDHWWFGRDREGGNEKEGCPIAYDTRRFAKREVGQFWLGVDPDQPSSLTWINDVPRICTWGRFEERKSGHRFVVANVHMDHLVPGSRTKAVELLLSRLPRGDADEPVILVGDFNSPAWSKPHRLLTRGADAFHDTFDLAREGESRWAGTFHHFKGKGFARFDWILTRPAVDVARLRIVRDRPDGYWPSDHFAVVADLEIAGGAGATPRGAAAPDLRARAV